MKQAHLASYSCSENLIDRYISNRVDQTRADGSFAQPIEDEDIFNIGQGDTTESKSPELDYMINSSGHCLDEQEREYPDTLNLDTSEGKDRLYQSDGMNEDADLEDIVRLPESSHERRYNRVDVDDMFPDDYSDSWSPKKTTRIDSQENTDPEKPPCSGELKRLQFLETVRKQALEKCRIVRKVSLDQVEGGLIEVGCKSDHLVSDSNSKFIFNKLFSKSAERSKDDIEHGKSSWVTYKAMLRKRISGRKRKTWDMFQKPVDGFDDEEELIEEPGEKEARLDEVDDQGVDDDAETAEFDDEEMEQEPDEDIEDEEEEVRPVKRYRQISDDDEDDEMPEGNFEDLEREDALVLDEAEDSNDGNSERPTNDIDDLDDDNLSDLESDYSDSDESD